MVASRQEFAVDDALINDLRKIVGRKNVLSEPDELLVYECDGLAQYKHPPRAVVFPNSTEETSGIVALLSEAGVSFAPRGAGTGLSGGALAVDRGVVIELARMREILRIDPENRVAVVQTGLVNAQLSRAVAPYGLYYVPDPSSQPACTIGGNIAENAGGIHCLKYGTTTDHVIGARVVLSDGSIVDLYSGAPGYDLLGTFVGSEGTFGIATEAMVKLSPVPPAVRTLLADFTDVNAASHAVSAIIAAGMLPAALEMMDNEIIRAVEASALKAGLPIDAAAVLLVELDGIEAGIDDDAQNAETILRHHGARSVHRAANENERKKLWAARKGAFGAIGRLMPDVMIQDAVVPRSRLPEVLAETYRISAQYKLKLANVFHAGDGNLHPLICFDLRRGDDLERVRQAGREIMETCVRAGGSISGEHGVGLDKSIYLPLIFSDDDMSAMLQVRTAFDPSGLCNPGKIIPAPRGCGEARAIASSVLPASAGLETAGLINEALANNPASKTLDGRGIGLGIQSTSDSDAPKGPTTVRLAERINEARVANELKRMVGAANARRLIDTELADRFADCSGRERTLVVSPGTAAEAAEVIKAAARQGLAVIPAGSASWLDVGQPLSRLDLILNTRRMMKMIRHEPADLVATAEAGLSLRQFQNQLAENGQWLPIDPPDDGTATLGGVVATGISGPQSLGYGSLRSFVIGMRAVLADGRIIKVGGNVVKNVAGYDLCKLFAGSYGTLGLITELTFKLRPLPAETRTVGAFGPGEALLSVGQRLANTFFATTVELASARLSESLSMKGQTGECLLLVRFAGSSRSVVTQTAQALKILRDEGIRCATYDDDELIWQKLAAASAENRNNLIWRVQVRQTDLSEFIKELSIIESEGASHIDLEWHTGLGDGRVRAMARSPVYHREAVRALTELRQRAERLGGGLVVERAPIDVKNEFDSWGGFGSATELMQRVKQQLDPENILSPGRFFA